jgi:hypothetical protein
MHRVDAAPLDTVIVTHRGSSPYLQTCLRRARIAAGSGRVVLLGDRANAMIGIGEHHMIDDPSLQIDLDGFRNAYRMVSRSHELTIERFWAERWFLIRNFLRRENLDGCLAIDSDVLLFCDVAEESRRFGAYAMTFGHWGPVRVVPHCNFIRGRAALESFCDYMLEIYRDQRGLDRLTNINRKWNKSSWISDMSLFAAWAARSGYPIGYLEDTLADGVGYDSCLDQAGHYVGCGYLPGIIKQWKRISFRDGVPYGMVRGSGLEVPMKCLHYHGRMKKLIHRHDLGLEDDWSAAWAILTDKCGHFPTKVRVFCRNYLVPRRPPAGRSTKD